MSSFLSDNAQISIESFPYRHLVIENFLEDELAVAVNAYFDHCIGKAAPVGKVGEVGDLQYSALNYTPDLTDISASAISVFGSDDLRNFICDTLGAQSNDCLMIGSHRHEPPSKDGWPHTDCAVVSYPKNGSRYNGFNVFQPDSGCIYADDTRDRQPDSLKMARSVACLYYHGNHDWQPGDGGETAIYLADKKTIAKKVPPIHNSLFAFEISPDSLHGYLGIATIRSGFLHLVVSRRHR